MGMYGESLFRWVPSNFLKTYNWPLFLGWIFSGLHHSMSKSFYWQVNFLFVILSLQTPISMPCTHVHTHNFVKATSTLIRCKLAVSNKDYKDCNCEGRFYVCTHTCTCAGTYTYITHAHCWALHLCDLNAPLIWWWKLHFRVFMPSSITRVSGTCLFFFLEKKQGWVPFHYT